MAKGRRRSAVYETEYQALMRRVREARHDAGMTQTQVARALKRPLSFVSKCELGERRIDPIDLVKFAELYDKPYEYFLPKRRARKESSP
jgi:transcriptional regulator with XRE-family HTH domain